jgi:hypothetical protein
LDIATSGEIKEGVDSLHERLSASGKPKGILRPLSRALSGLNVVNIGDTVVLPLGRPDAGRVWILTRLTVLGDDDHTTKAGLVGALYVGDDANVGLSQCVRAGTTIPFTTTENERGYVVHDRETAFLNFTATAPNITGMVVANALVWDYRDSDVVAQAI